ncbi:MAG: MucB/RseB C-terminal domain-containing protein [Pseudomonadota bacterium]
MRPWRGCGWLVSLVLLTGSVQAADDAAALLERMVRSAHQLNYSGTFVYEQGGALQSMRIIHAASEQGERERLVSLSGPSREVVRSRERVTCILPEDDHIVVENARAKRPFSFQLPTDLEPLRRYYRIALDGEERIAGMEAKKVVIAPRDEFRYGQNFWLASDTGLLLRAEVVNEQGRVIEQVMFTSLEVHDAIPKELLEPQVNERDQVVELDRHTTPASSEGLPQWQVAELPPGFTLHLQRNHYLPGKRFPVEHHVYNDGLASVSVFIEKRSEDDNAFSGPSAMGGVNAYGRMLDDHSVTVVGEVPPVTVQHIAESLGRAER